MWRVILKLIFYAAAIIALCWLVPQIAASFNRATADGSTPDASRAYALFAVYLLVGGTLALLLALDVSRFLGAQAGLLFWSGGRIASITPAWWKAERLRKERQPLDAIRVLREYHNAHPRQWTVAARIAEIYGRDLADPLAAALEYESLLQLRLTEQARAEILLRLAACHLLRHEIEECAARLRQVIQGFPNTAVAQKATRRLMRLENPPTADFHQTPPRRSG